MLDIYLYRRNKKRKRITIKDANKELIELLEQSPIKELRELKEYSRYIDKPLIECLREAINGYVGVIYGGVQSEEVSHSKGLWSVLCMFKDYTDNCSNMVLKQDTVKELFDLVTKSLCDVERHFEDKGYSILSSPLNDDMINLLLEKDGITFDEAVEVFVCKKMAKSVIDENTMDPYIKELYRNNVKVYKTLKPHVLYIGEIIGHYVRES